MHKDVPHGNDVAPLGLWMSLTELISEHIRRLTDNLNTLNQSIVGQLVFAQAFKSLAC